MLDLKSKTDAELVTIYKFVKSRDLVAQAREVAWELLKRRTQRDRRHIQELREVAYYDTYSPREVPL